MSSELRRRTAVARRLRQPMPRAEFLLWRAVRNRQLGGYKIRRQHPINRFVVDFACVEAKLVVELDGASHGPRQARDAERTSVLERCGWRVVRFTNVEIGGDLQEVLARLLRELRLGAG